MSGPCPLVVVGIDGSPHAGAALKWSVAEAERRGATLDILHAWEGPSGAAGAWGAADLAARRPGHLETEAWLLAGKAAAEARALSPDLKIRLSVVHAPASEALVRAAQGALVLVIGVLGWDGFTAMALGSTARHCLQHATCPVVIVPIVGVASNTGSATGGS